MEIQNGEQVEVSRAPDVDGSWVKGEYLGLEYGQHKVRYQNGSQSMVGTFKNNQIRT